MCNRLCWQHIISLATPAGHFGHYKFIRSTAHLLSQVLLDSVKKDVSFCFGT
uniref:Uncharacterized protein n=1 Tax=Anguilla anguilla TaxID=7936 RepID=A0A0E9WMS1_ANGAN